jgi:hypothetical protein
LWRIPAHEVDFGKCISSTFKSGVFLAKWHGIKIVAKTLKVGGSESDSPSIKMLASK